MKEPYDYDQACEDYDQDLRAGERPSPWDYCPPIDTEEM